MERTIGSGRLLNVDDLAALFDCCTETIKRMARQGHLPAFKLGRNWYVRETDLEAQFASAVESLSRLRRNQENPR